MNKTISCLEENELISIVVPVYNVEPYLKRCLDSIIEQTYKNIEIILVNDGSTDESGKICENYKQKDKRIILIEQKNSGLSEARNAGVIIAKGKYITFVDSDDFIHKLYIERLYKLLKFHHAQISCIGIHKFYSVPFIENDLTPVVRLFSGMEAIKDMWYQRMITNSAWAKMYETRLFESVLFPKGRLYEDLGTIYKLFYEAEIIAVSTEVLYYYFQRPDSIMNQKFDIKKFDRIEVSKELIRWADCVEDKLYKAALTRYFVSNVQVLREIPFEIKYKKDIEKIWKEIKKYRFKVIKNKEAKGITRLIAMSSYGGKYLLKALGKYYKHQERKV